MSSTGWLTGQWPQLGQVAGKAGLLYVTALVGLRLAERRTLAQLTIIDVVAAVAVGAVVGRTAVAGNQSYVTGAVALVTLLVVHRLVSLLRLWPPVVRLTDHRVRVLVRDGQVRRGQLHLCGLTQADLYAQLRQRGVLTLDGLAFVLYEAKGGLTIVPAGPAAVPELVQAALVSSAGYPAEPSDVAGGTA